VLSEASPKNEFELMTAAIGAAFGASALDALGANPILPTLAVVGDVDAELQRLDTEFDRMAAQHEAYRLEVARERRQRTSPGFRQFADAGLTVDDAPCWAGDRLLRAVMHGVKGLRDLKSWVMQHVEPRAADELVVLIDEWMAALCCVARVLLHILATSTVVPPCDWRPRVVPQGIDRDVVQPLLRHGPPARVCAGLDSAGRSTMVVAAA
jgi:hypothetical protein